MPYKFGFIVSLSLCASILYGNVMNTSDSFITGNNRASLQDSVDYLLNQADQMIESNPSEAFVKAVIAKQISAEYKWEEKRALACKYLGEAKMQLEDFYQAKKYLSDALNYYKNSKSKITADLFFLLGKTNYFLGEYQEANADYREAISYYEKVKDLSQVAKTYQNIGLIHHELDDLSKASLYYNKALELNTILKNDTNIAGLLQNLGIIYYRNGDYDKALDYYEKSIYIYNQLADTESIGITFSNIGLIQLNQNYYKEAYNSFVKSKELFEKVNFRMGKMWALYNMGTAKVSMKDYPLAETLYKESITLAKDLHSKEGVISNLEALTELNARKGTFEAAYFYQIAATNMKDSIKTIESREKIAELESLYNLEAQEKQIAASVADIRREKAQNTAFIFVLVLLSITSVIIYLAYRQKKQSQLETYSRKLELENVLVERTKELENQITERKVAEESDKLKSAFLANMSHELRTPMNAIIAFSNFLRDPELPSRKHSEYLNHITNAGDSLLRLIDDIIDIAKLESKQLKISIGPANISRMLRELRKVFQKLRIKNNFDAELVLSLDANVDYIINTDILRVKQILSNLIENAFKYTPRGAVEFGVKRLNDGLLFFVRDTGIGISREKQQRIYDRFLQIDSELNRKYGGTGLGLAICKNLTELLGGKIWLESEPEKGSTFFVLIPATDIRMVEVASDSTNASMLIQEKNYDWATKTILVAEDEELNYKVLDSCLSKTNARILRASDGEKAVEIFRNEKIDIVLMDIQMPIMDGYIATQIIKKINKSVPVIAQTSFAMANEKEKCLNAGCDDYLTKPLDLEKLLSTINRLIYQPTLK
jgi:signal transduction histidine kinase/CheY-like chemotaxis protein